MCELVFGSDFARVLYSAHFELRAAIEALEGAY